MGCGHYLSLIGAMKQSIMQYEGGAVRGERVALHLPEAHAAAAPPPLHGLARQRVHCTRRTDLDNTDSHVHEALKTFQLY